MRNCLYGIDLSVFEALYKKGYWNCTFVMQQVFREWRLTEELPLKLHGRFVFRGFGNRNARIVVCTVALYRGLIAWVCTYKACHEVFNVLFLRFNLYNEFNVL